MIRMNKMKLAEFLTALRGDALAVLKETMMKCQGANLETDAGRTMLADMFEDDLLAAFRDENITR